MCPDKSYDTQSFMAPSCDIFNLGSSYFHVQLTTVRHLLNVALITVHHLYNVFCSGPNDHIFVNFVDHGAPGLLGFPSDEVSILYQSSSTKYMLINLVIELDDTDLVNWYFFVTNWKHFYSSLPMDTGKQSDVLWCAIGLPVAGAI